jgi:hypothetical protein
MAALALPSQLDCACSEHLLSADFVEKQHTPIVPITQRHQHERTQQDYAHTLRFPNDTTNTRPYCVMRVVEER